MRDALLPLKIPDHIIMVCRPRVLVLRRIYPTFLAVRGLVTTSIYLLTPDFKSVSPATQDRGRPRYAGF